MRKKYGKYFVTIGLEIHIALKTKEKLFSTNQNSFSNPNLALIDMALPGALPVLSKEAVELAVLFGISTHSRIHQVSEFERKHYFYPDLSLGYQITQQNNPILGSALIEVYVPEDNYHKVVEIEHSHLECDAAKSLHDLHRTFTAIDLSRSGTALIESVTKPCIHTPQEAKAYAKHIHNIVQTLDICDGKLEEGSFRVDASISINEKEDKLGTRVELKNISSFSFLEQALEYEIQRQIDVISSGGLVKMQTRLWDEKDMETKEMRDKESVQDYKYMIDPDIPKLVIDEHFIHDVRQKFFSNFTGLYQFWTVQAEKFNIVLKNDLLIDLIKSPSKIIFIKIYEDYKNIELNEKIMKAIFFWIPDVISKLGLEELDSSSRLKLVKLQDLIKFINTNIEAKEFKEAFFTMLKEQKFDWNSFMPQEDDIEYAKDLVSRTITQFISQAYDDKTPRNKRIQFITGQCIKLMKSENIANKKTKPSTISEIVDTLIN